jgi:hypothetical protein
MMSFAPIGSPSIGESGRPSFQRLSEASAARLAEIVFKQTNAWTSDSRISTFAKRASKYLRTGFFVVRFKRMCFVKDDVGSFRVVVIAIFRTELV